MSAGAPELLRQARSVVVKVGSSLIIGDTQRVRQQWLDSLAADIAQLCTDGIRVVVVSSGAVALGRPALGIERRNMQLAHKQAAAAAGQVLLLQAWRESLAAHNIGAAQVLLTPQDTEKEGRRRNACATMDALAEHDLIAIINENDTVATDELRYGDNDQLAARVAQMIGAHSLILLSDVEGLFDADPRTSSAARHVARVPDVDAALGFVQRDQLSDHGTGGMHSKLLAAQLACNAGVSTVIAGGIDAHPLRRLQQGARCTVIDVVAQPEGCPA
ncbi:MAG: glutamate 5-kinase [Pseudomonadota bacterium]